MRRLLRFFWLPLLALASNAQAQTKAVVVVIDGVRNLEMEGLATDDEGKKVPFETLFPQLSQIKKGGVYLSEMRISNPVGISLPAYADLFAGRRQEKIVSNEPNKKDFHSHYPTLFQAARKAFKKSDSVLLIASWGPLCRIAVTPDGGESNDFFRSCGAKKGRDLKPEIFEGSRSDMDNFLIASEEIPKRHPNLIVLHFGDADEEAHLQRTVQEKKGLNYGIFNYHKALRETDYYIGRLKKLVDDDPYYKDSTYFIVTTDHGRDNVPQPGQWTDHGECLKTGEKKLCSGCQHVFALAMGPGLHSNIVKTEYSQRDLAPTVARLLGAELPSATGRVIPELLPAAKESLQ